MTWIEAGWYVLIGFGCVVLCVCMLVAFNSDVRKDIKYRIWRPYRDEQDLREWCACNKICYTHPEESGLGSYGWRCPKCAQAELDAEKAAKAAHDTRMRALLEKRKRTFTSALSQIIDD